MKSVVPVIIRFFLILAVVTAGYIGYTSLSSANAPTQFSSLVELFNRTSPIKINPNSIALTAKQKLVDQQPIIQDNPESEMKPSVMGETTTAVSQQAKEFVSSTTEKISTELKDIPKDQAVKVLRSTCDQLIAELEK